jgi:hypothetical protein
MKYKKLDTTIKFILIAIFIFVAFFIYTIIGSIIQGRAVYECRTQGYETATLDIFTHETECKYPMYIQDKS